MYICVALKEYEPAVKRLTDLLISQLHARGGTAVDAVEWINFYAFDVMGQVGFGKPWGMLETGNLHEAIDQLHGAWVSVGVLGHVPWLLRLATEIPGADAVLQGFMDWCWAQLAEKQKVAPFPNKIPPPRPQSSLAFFANRTRPKKQDNRLRSETSRRHVMDPHGWPDPPSSSHE